MPPFGAFDFVDGAVGSPWNLWLRLAKRSFDVIVGGVLAIVSIPFVVAVAVVLAVQLRAWPFFAHYRVGTHGERLWFPKLRTLPTSTPRFADKTVVALAPVSKLAAKLRDTHLDEIPQLWLVVAGKLSLVGPRPRMHAEVEQHPNAAFDTARVSVRQGCTGLWQVGAHTDDTVTASPHYDLSYVRHATLRLDLWILWRTAVQAFGGRGVDLGDVPARLLHPGHRRSGAVELERHNGTEPVAAFAGPAA